MSRTTQSDLDAAAAAIADATGRDVSVRWAYGRPRLEEGGGYRELSPRLPSGQLLDVLHGILTGIRLASPHEARPRWDNGQLSRTCQTCLHGIYRPGAAPADYGSDGWRHNPRRRGDD